MAEEPDIIRHKRGEKANLPELLESEFAFTRDTEEVFIGTKEGKLRIATEHDTASTVMFILSGDVLPGIADLRNVLPYEVRVLQIRSYSEASLAADLTFDIQYTTDYLQWYNLTEQMVRIPAGVHINEDYVLTESVLPAETMLRIYVRQAPYGARNLTVNITVIPNK